jgi:hypothetical protein
MDEQEQTETESAAKESGGGSPMAMDMAMMKKMMAQMGSGGEGPMAVMQKMMGQMGQGKPVAEAESPMQHMMGMCMSMYSETLTATPELQNAFAGWLDQYEEKVASAPTDGDKDTAALAVAVGLSEDSVRYLVMRLAATGKVDLACPPGYPNW